MNSVRFVVGAGVVVAMGLATVGCKAKPAASPAPQAPVVVSTATAEMANMSDWMKLIKDAEKSLENATPAGGEQALAILQKAAGIAPANNAYLARTFARAYIQTGKLDLATDYLKKSLIGEPSTSDQAYSDFLYADVYRAKGDLKTAKTYAEKAVALVPGDKFFQQKLEELSKSK